MGSSFALRVGAGTRCWSPSVRVRRHQGKSGAPKRRHPDKLLPSCVIRQSTFLPGPTPQPAHEPAPPHCPRRPPSPNRTRRKRAARCAQCRPPTGSTRAATRGAARPSGWGSRGSRWEGRGREAIIKDGRRAAGHLRAVSYCVLLWFLCGF